MLRLVASVIISWCAGALVLALLHQRSHTGKEAFRVYGFAGGAFICLVTSLVLLWKPWRLEDVMQRMIGFLSCLWVGILLQMLALKPSAPAAASVAQLVIGTLSVQGAALIFAWLFLKEHQTGWKEAFGFGHHWPQAVMLGIIMAGIYLPIGMGLKWLSGEAMMHLSRLHLKPEQQQAVQALQTASTLPSRLISAVLTILLAPVAEEILFRGILYTWIKKECFPRLALWGSALFFAAVHANLLTFVPLTVLALALTLLYEKTGNLLAPITTHAVFNGMNFIALYYVMTLQ